MANKLTKIIDFYPEFLTGRGLFNGFVDPPWSADPAIDPANLDIAFFTRYGQRTANAFLTVLAKDEPVTPPLNQKICQVLLLEYKNKWQRLYDASKLEYQPIENYDKTEEIIRKKNNTGSQTDDGHTSHGHIVTTEDTTTTTTDDSIHAFSSTSAVPTDSSKETNGGNVTETHSGDDTNGNTRTDDLHEDETITNKTHGNIGVTTSQQMLQSEIDLWQWRYFDSVFTDIADAISLTVY